MMKKLYLIPLAVCVLSVATGCGSHASWTAEEKNLIDGSGDVMRVLVIDEPEDLAVLRAESVELTDEDLSGSHFTRLAEKMISTVTSPEQDGVGIAAPQVGIGRRLIAVQRFDKDGEPFEIYPNIRIESFFGERLSGREGCLSIPGKYGYVTRSQGVVITWKDPETLQQMRDTVEGYTAVIFQHEVDHLDGILYTDKADSLFVRNNL